MKIKLKMTDEELVSSFASGDNTSFDELLRRYQDKVFGYILQSVKSKEVADDIFQETFVKTIMCIRQGRYEENGKFGAWLGRVAHNLVIDYFRREKSEGRMSIDEQAGAPLLNRKELCDGNIEDEIIDIQITQDLRTLVKNLPKLQRDVLLMRYYRNMSFKEIAEKTGVSINTALGRMRYAILNLRKLAEEKQVVLSR